MAQKLGITDYIYYGVNLKVSSIVDLSNNKIMVQFKPIKCEGDLSELKNKTLVYIAQRTNKGLFKFMYETNSQIQAYALTLKKKTLAKDIYLTNRLFMDKPGRK